MLMIQCQRLVAVRSALIQLPSSFRMRVSHGTDVFGRGKKKKKKNGVLTTPIGIAVCSIFSRYTLCLYYITDQFFF